MHKIRLAAVPLRRGVDRRNAGLGRRTAEADLPEMLGAGEQGECLRQRVEVEYPADHGLERMLGDRARHRLEAVAAADRDPLQPDVTRDDGPEPELEVAPRQHADE